MRAPAPDNSLQIEAPEFNFCFCAPLIEFKFEAVSRKMTIRAAVDENAHLLLSLNGVLPGQEVLVHIEFLERRPRAEFVASSLRAILSLTRSVSIKLPESDIPLDSPTEQSLLKISHLLRARQTAYRLMVIERATGKKFRITSDVTEQDAGYIAFAYRAIVDRSFIWAFDPKKITALATQKYLAQLPQKGQPMRYENPFDHLDLTILGEIVSLGSGTVFMEDFFIVDEDKVRSELAINDGHTVEYISGSLSGQATWNCPEAPRLPDSPWDSKIQSLIDLESKLDARLSELYNALAASTLEGLTEEEKRAVTARPELDEEAFLMNDSDEEDE